MTTSPFTSDADRPADKGLPESTDGSWPETRDRIGDEADLGQESTAPWDGEDAKEDEHLKQYMAKFLKTHNIGGPTAEDDHAERQESTKAPVSYGTKAPTVASGTVTPVVTPVKARDPEGPTKPTKPPESTENVREWRRLANTNIRRAIELHAFRQSVWMMRLYLTLGLVSIICSVGLLWIASHTSASAYTLGVGLCVVAAIACLCYLRQIKIIGQMSSRNKRTG